ncbi:hypothetical protein [Salinarimonas rosea]|uniref:hypothetical protein n=1 Tax=Salinarimonas rosea TaxID=552063 RepID=UPI000419A9C6|nr:hypothetical protein [Salinarimonas rosea]
MAVQPDPNARFLEIAEDLFGESCARPTARVLGLRSERAVQRWLNGQNPVPVEVLDRLARAAQDIETWDPGPILALQGDIPDGVYAEILRRIAGQIDRRAR